jgi:hypothetical protein
MTDESAPPPAPAAVAFDPSEDDREIVDMPETGYPLPEIFLMPDDANANTATRIDIVWVYKKTGDKQWPCIDQRPIGDLRTLQDICGAYGAGQYRLIGRNAENMGPNVKISHQTLGTVDDEDELRQRAIVHHAPAAPAREIDIPKVGAAILAIAQPILTLYETIAARRSDEQRIEREAQDRRFQEQLARERQQHETMMSVVTAALNGRHEDDRLRAPAGADSAESYKAGQADMLAALEAAKEAGLVAEGGEGQLMELFGSFLQGTAAAKAKKPAPSGNGAGSNGADS